MTARLDIPDPEAEAAAGDLLLVLAAYVRTRLRTLVSFGVAGGLVAAGVVFARPRSWTAQLSFAPQTRRTVSSPAGLSSLAAQFGVAVPGSDPSQSPQFYSALITGQTIMGALVDSTVPGPSGAVRLATILGQDIGGTDSTVERERAIRALRLRVGVAADTKTGVVSVSVRMPSPKAAAHVGELLLRQLEEFNVSSRRTQARAERAFTEERIKATARELDVAERAMQDFLGRNLDYRNSPALLFTYDRLNRQLQLRQAVQASLVQSLEQARIDEVRDTPTITIVERPQPPAVPDSRRVPLVFVFGFALGAAVGLAAAEWRARREAV
jgi:hypothetical protein